MCFSADASLAAGAALLPAGAYAVSAAWRKDRRYLPFAATPVLFGVQQFCEAAVWLGLGRGDPGLVRPASLAFLFFAFAVWPAWIPAGVAAIEPRGARRRAFAAAAGVGLAVGLAGYVPAAVYFDAWAEVRVVRHSIRYDFSALPAGLAAASLAWQGLYLAAVGGPLLLSRDQLLRAFGVGVAAAAAVSHVVFQYAFASVWCFFAALLSAHLCYLLYRLPAPGGGGVVVGTGVPTGDGQDPPGSVPPPVVPTR